MTGDRQGGYATTITPFKYASCRNIIIIKVPRGLLRFTLICTLNVIEGERFTIGTPSYQQRQKMMMLVTIKKCEGYHQLWVLLLFCGTEWMLCSSRCLCVFYCGWLSFNPIPSCETISVAYYLPPSTESFSSASSNNNARIPKMRRLNCAAPETTGSEQQAMMVGWSETKRVIPVVDRPSFVRLLSFGGWCDGSYTISGTLPVRVVRVCTGTCLVYVLFKTPQYMTCEWRHRDSGELDEGREDINTEKSPWI